MRKTAARVIIGATLVAPLPGGLVAQADWAANESRRSGFIIGFGLGPGVSFFTGGQESDTKVGVATDFRIGAQLGPTAQVYWVSKVNFTGGTLRGFDRGDLMTTGVGGLGVTILPSPQVHLSAGVGFGTLGFLDLDGGSDAEYGFGFTAGVGYEFADLWILDVSGSYIRPGDDIFWFKIGINILSH